MIKQEPVAGELLETSQELFTIKFMPHRQIRIFVPPALDHNCWVETVVGRVIKPTVEESIPKWIWFSRYGEGRDGSNVDCDINKIPETFGPNGFYRSVRFRVCIPAETQGAFEQATLERIATSGFAASGFVDYPYIADLTQDRFIAEPRTQQRKQRRAELMAEFLNASAKLFMDALIGPDAQQLYRLEHNANGHCNSSFEAIRHLFCNMTNAPTLVIVNQQDQVQPNPAGENQIVARLA